MIKLVDKHGLPFISICVENNKDSITIENALIDTGSMSTIISADALYSLGIKAEPNDVLHAVSGVGGSEFVFEKTIEKLKIADTQVPNMKVQVGAMDYGFGIDAILGMDWVKLTKSVIDIKNMLLIFEK